jgi:hypothetical protein
MKAIRLTAVAVLVVGVALSLADAAAAARSTSLYGAPAVGSCYDVSGRTASDKASTSTRPVNCHKPHTLWVVAVTAMPERYVAEQHDGSNLKGKALIRFDRVCLPAIGRAVGGLGENFARSAYAYYWFVATAAQQQAGGHWMSCSVGIAKVQHLVVTRKHAPTRITNALPNALQLCGTRSYAGTTCAARHLYRQTYAFAVGHRLTRTTAQAAARRTCPMHVSSTSWMSWWRSITPKDNFITCLTETRR